VPLGKSFVPLCEPGGVVIFVPPIGESGGFVTFVPPGEDSTV
jgi:hypothetical protein